MLGENGNVSGTRATSGLGKKTIRQSWQPAAFFPQFGQHIERAGLGRDVIKKIVDAKRRRDR